MLDHTQIPSAQAERRLFLIRYLLREGGYDQPIPQDLEGQRALLRGLMNIREPGPIGEDFLQVQDAYLTQRAEEKGIVDVEDFTPLRGRICLWQGDITRLKAGGIVNACNSGLTGCYAPNHACIDNQIHTFAGVQLRQKCAELTQGLPEPTGRARITSGYNLPASHVIHTVGTICRGIVTPKNERELTDCYKSCMAIAAEHHLPSIVFCCLSTGVFGFPQKRGAELAVATVEECLRNGCAVDRVVFNVFTEVDLALYQGLLR
jgi:O-acetyl-ADP-ribose deacetylase (regulator of RNase III)